MTLGRSPIFERLDALADELASVSRDARAIYDPRHGIAPPSDKGNVADMASFLLGLRNLRDAIFGPPPLFDDCAWDMVLHLIKAENEGTSLSVSRLCAAISAPQTTAIRKLDNLVGAGFVIRRPDPHDRRRIIVNLTDRSRQLFVLLCERATGKKYQRPNFPTAA